MVSPLIRGFRDRNTRLFFEGNRVAAFQGFADQAARRLTYLDNAESTWQRCRAIAWNL